MQFVNFLLKHRCVKHCLTLDQQCQLQAKQSLRFSAKKMTMALLAYRYPQIFRRTAASANFERPFTPRTWLRSARNFGNARFGRFATFDFSTRKKLGEIFGSKNHTFVNLEVLEDLRPNGRQNQLPRQILLQIDLF